MPFSDDAIAALMLISLDCISLREFTDTQGNPVYQSPPDSLRNVIDRVIELPDAPCHGAYHPQNHSHLWR